MWTEKYRPSSWDDYMFINSSLRDNAEAWVTNQEIDAHVMFSGNPGTGKTSLAHLILKLMNIPEEDRMFIPASKENRIDDVREKISKFASSWAFGPTGVKYIILDEVDRFSMASQELLKGEMEANASVCRYILTCNNPQRLTSYLHSRIQQFRFVNIPRDDFTIRLGEVLVSENVEFTEERLLKVVDFCYPDLRKAINVAQQYSKKGVLEEPAEEVKMVADFILEAAALFMAGKTTEARKFLVSKAQIEDYPDIFRFMYDNLSVWGDTEEKQDEALLIIRRGLVNCTFCSDQEINLSATMVELTQLSKTNPF